MQREIIKWLQSLDLSFTIKNPRRELSNGFLVAEILSRYIHSVPMHSFDTGAGMPRKIDNWQQLGVIFQRNEMEVSKETMDGIIEMKDPHATRLLEYLYTALTKRTLKPNVIQERIVKEKNAQPPGYARPTAARVLQESNDDTKLRLKKLVGDIDAKKEEEHNLTVLQQHEEALAMQKAKDPNRFKIKKTMSKEETLKQRELAQIQSKVKAKMLEAKMMDVKSIDDNLIATFAEREASKDNDPSADFDVQEDLGRALSRVCSRPLVQCGMFTDLDPKTGHFFCSFIEALGTLPVEVRDAVWNTVIASSSQCATYILARPEEFVHITFGLSFLFKHTAASVHADATDFDKALQFIAHIGDAMVKGNGTVALDVMESYLLPACSRVISSGPVEVRTKYLEVCSAYCNLSDENEMKRFVRAVQRVVDPAVFYLCLCEIIAMSEDSESIAEMCSYYATPSLQSANPIDRACGIMLLRRLCTEESHAMLEPHLAHLASFASQWESWEVRVLLLELACAVDAFLPSDMLINAFKSFDNDSVPMKKVSLKTVAPFFAGLTSDVRQLFLKRLLTFDYNDRHELVQPSVAAEAIPGKVRPLYLAGDLSADWISINVAETVVEMQSQLSVFKMISLLEAAMTSTDFTNTPKNERMRWMSVARASKTDLLHVIYQPGTLQFTNEDERKLCTDISVNIIVMFFTDVAQMLNSLNDMDPSERSEDEVQQMASEWFQNNV